MQARIFFIGFSFIFLWSSTTEIMAQDTITGSNTGERLADPGEFILLNGENAFSDAYDSSLYGIQNTNPVLFHNGYTQYTGNLGGAAWNGHFYREPLPLKIRYGLHPFDAYDFGIQPGILNKKRIFTSLRYSRGSKKEQYFLLMHKQRFGKRLYAGLDFAAGASQGFYARQLSSLRNFDLYTLFHTRDLRYGIYAKFIYNKADCQENGGLKYDSALTGVSSADARTLPVWLSDAQRIHKEKAVYLQHQFFLTRPVKPEPDSTGYLKFQKYKADLAHVFYFQDKGTIFQTGTVHTDLYPFINYDSTSTFDSTHYRTYFNDLRATFSIHDFASAEELFDADFFAGGSQQTVKLNQRELEIRCDEWSLYGGFRLIFMEMCALDLKYTKTIQSSLEGEQAIEGGIRYRAFNDFLVWKVRYVYEERNPDLFFQFNYSNHYKWRNRFQPVKEKRFDVNFDLPWLNLFTQLSWLNQRHYLYFNETADPNQFDGKISIFAADLRHQLNYRDFHLINNILIQTTDHSSLVRLPRYSTIHSFYYERSFFKHALLTQIGLGLQYSSSYYSPYYQPATGQFILQNQMAYGDYLFANAFINFKVKTARFFFKVEHLNAGWSKKNYMILAHYPMPGRMLKFGVAWNLFD